LVGLIIDGRADEALAILDSKPPRMRSEKRFGLLCAAVLQAAGRRRTLEKYLLDLVSRFPGDAEVMVEVAEFYCDDHNFQEASRWLRKTKLALRKGPPRNKVEVEELVYELMAEVLVRRGQARAAQRLLVAALQERPYSSRLASSLDLVHQKNRAR
jgi:predicted Zn-dependent protease